MNVYVFENVNLLTGNEHAEGGLVLLARDDAEARALIAEHVEGRESWRGPTGVSEGEWANVIRYPLAGEHEPRAFIFPDAGCC